MPGGDGRRVSKGDSLWREMYAQVERLRAELAEVRGQLARADAEIERRAGEAPEAQQALVTRRGELARRERLIAAALGNLMRATMAENQYGVAAYVSTDRERL